jgi:hypothetical protein
VSRATLPVNALGTVRCIARYLVFNRPASMTFYYTVPGLHVPDRSDCEAVAFNHVAWERGLFGILGGYNNLRSEDCDLISTTVQNVDRRGPASFFRNESEVGGLIPSFLRKCLPTSLAPVVFWHLENGARLSRGRTYAVGCTSPALFATDQQAYAFLDRLAVTQMFDNLRAIQLANGAQMVHVVTRMGGAPLALCPTFKVLSASDTAPLLGSQRRRTD